MIPLPEIVLIAAVARENRVIGRGMELPWHLPEDLKRFKSLTEGHPLLMGRRTFESIVHQFGGPLPNRRNIVLTTTGELPDYPDIETYPSIKDALQGLNGEERLYVGGGGQVYYQFLPLAHRLELTLVDGSYHGDAFFPPFEHLIDTVFRTSYSDSRDAFSFVTYDRVPQASSQSC